MRDTRKITVSIKKDIWKRLDKMSRKLGIKKQHFANEAIDKLLKEKGW